MLLFSELKKRNLLSNESMSAVRGGGSCGYYTGDGKIRCNVAKSEALNEVAAHGGHWCCDSCESSTYCAGAEKASYIFGEAIEE